MDFEEVNAIFPQTSTAGEWMLYRLNSLVIIVVTFYLFAVTSYMYYIVFISLLLSRGFSELQ